MNNALIILYIIIQGLIVFGLLFWVLPDFSRKIVGNDQFQETFIFKKLEGFY